MKSISESQAKFIKDLEAEAIIRGYTPLGGNLHYAYTNKNCPLYIGAK